MTSRLRPTARLVLAKEPENIATRKVCVSHQFRGGVTREMILFPPSPPCKYSFQQEKARSTLAAWVWSTSLSFWALSLYRTARARRTPAPDIPFWLSLTPSYTSSYPRIPNPRNFYCPDLSGRLLTIRLQMHASSCISASHSTATNLVDLPRLAKFALREYRSSLERLRHTIARTLKCYAIPSCSPSRLISPTITSVAYRQRLGQHTLQDLLLS